jgi:hypothetical protein
MEWVYQDPLTKDERTAVKFLQYRMQDKRILVAVVKLLSLVKFLKTHKFSSSKKIRNSVFFDRQKSRPIFNAKTSDAVFKALKQVGGGEYPLTNHLVNKMGEFLKSVDPTPISWGIEKGFEIVKWPMSALESTSLGPFIEIGTSAIHGVTEAGVSGANGVGEAVGGPIGLAIVAPFTAIAAAAASCLAIAEGDFGQAIIHGINFIPAIGPALVKLLGKGEHMAEILDSKRGELENLPFGPIIVSFIPNLKEIPTGGKRFSTRKRYNSKWRTQRRLFVKH